MFGDWAKPTSQESFQSRSQTAAQAQEPAQQTRQLAKNDGKCPPRQVMLDAVQGVTDGMSINNAVLLVCAYKELFLEDIRERGLAVVIHEVSTTIVDVACQHEQGNYAEPESIRRKALAEIADTETEKQVQETGPKEPAQF